MKPMRAIILEDDPDDVLLIREMLSEASGIPFHLEHAGSLMEGLERVAQEQFDVALLDLNLPDSAGIKTVDDFKRRAPSMPFVVLTGLGDDQMALKAVQRGAQDYLVKGVFHGDALVRCVRYAIERFRLQADLAQQAWQLAISEERVRRIIETSIDGIIVLSGDGTIHFVNQAVERLFGRKSEELFGSTFGTSVLANETLEVEFDPPNVSPRIAEVRTVAAVWEDKPAILAFLRDVTDRKRAEELRNLET